MGLFGMFGKKASEKEEALRQQELQLNKEKELEALKEAHAELSWPVIQRINPVNVNGESTVEIEETVPPERKDEIGELIYKEEITPEDLQALGNQELLFLLAALEVYNKTAKLPGYDANHRKIYNEVIGRVRDSKVLYVLYDTNTGYPFIDHGFVNVYFENDLATKAAAVYEKQFRKLIVKEVKVENEDMPAANRKGFFDFLYYLGIENLLIDNGAYRARFKRSEIVAAPFDLTGNEENSPVNPALSFAMLDFLTEVKWPVNYEKRQEVLHAKEVRMLSLLRASKLIIPMQHEGPVEKLENGAMKLTKDTKFKFLIIKTKDNKQYLPVFTDAIEFSKQLHGTEWHAAAFTFADVLKFVSDKDGIRINPASQGIVLPKEKMETIELAGQQADALRGKKPVVPAQSGSVVSEDAAISKTINDALNRLGDNKE